MTKHYATILDEVVVLRSENAELRYQLANAVRPSPTREPIGWGYSAEIQSGIGGRFIVSRVNMPPFDTPLFTQSGDQSYRTIDDVPSCGQENDYRRAQTFRTTRGTKMKLNPPWKRHVAIPKRRRRARP